MPRGGLNRLTDATTRRGVAADSGSPRLPDGHRHEAALADARSGCEAVLPAATDCDAESYRLVVE